eukprot:501826-Amphidinium_carterae.1
MIDVSCCKSDRHKKPDDYGVDTMKITDDDAAFILGKGGKTKEKIARVSEVLYMFVMSCWSKELLHATLGEFAW